MDRFLSFVRLFVASVVWVPFLGLGNLLVSFPLSILYPVHLSSCIYPNKTPNPDSGPEPWQWSRSHSRSLSSLRYSMSPSPLLVPIGGFLTEFHSIHSSSSLVCLRSTHSACVIPTQLRQKRSRAACSFFGRGFLMRCVTPTPRRIHTGILRLLISLHRNRQCRSTEFNPC